jgi:hypothetical protein
MFPRRKRSIADVVTQNQSATGKPAPESSAIRFARSPPKLKKSSGESLDVRIKLKNASFARAPSRVAARARYFETAKVSPECREFSWHEQGENRLLDFESSVPGYLTKQDHRPALLEP